MEESENGKDAELALPSHNGDNSALQVLDWDSPQDPENPQNWPLGKKIYHTVCVAVYAFTM